MKIEEIRALHSSDREFVEAIIDECLFAFLVNYDGKINPISAKQMLLEHFELGETDE